ncbi:NAD(P)/FAD-dependent oxidoreductase [Streptomyces sp. TRM66268-LWL]|uniref:NAD(P)/FAD-dependent oxidoreductase n=1 Tax=Streptomyces polyasparticus TaxID=2767826 RepID=A0ABR7SP93_9ACTN|nr:FAD-dependent oxidoreductase [Streptomyces polyasparticus]MBC9716143.1 NAD(P)/FAD-dependent oxidoreductase [Streptomyces polyasparticus]
MGQRIVVIGAGTAGARLGLRLAGSDADVTLVGAEPHAPYNRVLLADVLAGRYPAEVTALPDAGPVVQDRVVRIDREARKVHLATAAPLPYDSLVLATGSNPVLPALRGLTHGLPENVHAFRTMDDCLALDEAVREGVRAVVIGGGLLGVLCAQALAERGAQVVLAQQGEHIMERQLDAEAAELVREHLRLRGVEVHTECRVREVRTHGGRAVGVSLADGYALGADLIVLACGVRPSTVLAREAGLEVRGGIVVDDELRTSDPAVHAIGDCAEHRGRTYGLATPALEQADALADLLLHKGGTYEGTRSLTRLTLSDAGQLPLDLATFGDPSIREGDDVIRLTDATRRTYRKVVVRDDRLVGGVLLGELGAVGALAEAWDAAEPLPQDASLHHLLTHDGGF